MYTGTDPIANLTKIDSSSMEEFHEAAIAYYNNGSNELRTLAWRFFQAMDADRDGRVSLQEYAEFLRCNGYDWVRTESFRELDRDRDGSLDFWEVLTLYYIARTRTISCRTCRRCLKGLYFTCVQCFDGPSDTFDLCVWCYRGQKYSHSHRCFLDSYVLLRSRRNHPQLPSLAIPPPPPPSPPPSGAIEAQQQPAGMGWCWAFQALEMALAAGNLATLCTIM